MMYSADRAVTWLCLPLCGFLSGCGLSGNAVTSSNPRPTPATAQPFSSSAQLNEDNRIALVCLRSNSDATAKKEDSVPPIVLAGKLSIDALVEQVLARNPSLAQMTAAYEAASARNPQAISLDDPMFGTMF